jgi:hypothetical protein
LSNHGHGEEESGRVERPGTATRREKKEGAGAVPPQGARSPGRRGQTAGSRAPASHVTTGGGGPDYGDGRA